TILISHDSGRSWTPVHSGTFGTLNSVTFAIDGRNGWIVGDYGLIFTTQDRGNSWTAIRDAGMGETLRGLSFAADGRTAWAVGDKGTILSTQDGGKSWTAFLNDTGQNLLGVTFTADGRNGWAVGTNSAILTSVLSLNFVE